MAFTNRTALARETTTTRQGNAVQEAARRQSQAADACLLVNGRLIEGIVLVAGTNTNVPHGLGRAYRGAIPTNANAGGQVVVTASPDPTKFVTLSLVTGNDTVAVWVF